MATRRRKGPAALRAEIEALTTLISSLRDQIEPKREPVAIDAVNGIDFYQIVSRFEAQLIGTALQMSGGRQNKAARLLHLRKSTLSWKIKRLEQLRQLSAPNEDRNGYGLDTKK